MPKGLMREVLETYKPHILSRRQVEMLLFSSNIYRKFAEKCIFIEKELRELLARGVDAPGGGIHAISYP